MRLCVRLAAFIGYASWKWFLACPSDLHLRKDLFTLQAKTLLQWFRVSIDFLREGCPHQILTISNCLTSMRSETQVNHLSPSFSLSK